MCDDADNVAMYILIVRTIRLQQIVPSHRRRLFSHPAKFHQLPTAARPHFIVSGYASIVEPGQLALCTLNMVQKLLFLTVAIFALLLAVVAPARGQTAAEPALPKLTCGSFTSEQHTKGAYKFAGQAEVELVDGSKQCPQNLLMVQKFKPTVKTAPVWYCVLDRAAQVKFCGVTGACCQKGEPEV